MGPACGQGLRVKTKKKPNIRAQAALILSQLQLGSGSLSSHLQPTSQDQDQPLLQEICFGCCRWFHQLEVLLQQLLEKPLRSKDQDIHCLLLVGLYQLRHMRVPDHAAINETVAATKALKKPWAKGLVNAVLRNWLRQKDSLEPSIAAIPSAAQSHPGWLLSWIETDWPQQSAEIFAANNERPPFTLRVNLMRCTLEAYREQLDSKGITHRRGKHSLSSLYIEDAVPVERLPGFAEGYLSIQDEASQLVPEILNLAPGQRVLDACAAPGGKTCHLLESEPELREVVAIEIDERRAARIHENLGRLGLQATVAVADITDLDSWWDGQEFDRILLDVPCSATGVIRRHPDIKLLRKPEHVEELRLKQLRILGRTWRCLKPGGLLLYTSCSILRRENTEIIATFLNDCPNAKSEAISADWGVECDYGRQLLPGSSNQDGFFYCLLRKELNANENLSVSPSL